MEMWVGYSPGGLTDILSRSLATIMSDQQGWQMAVINKPGAGSSVMLAELARTEPDGLVIGATTSPGAISRVPNKNPDNSYSVDDFIYLGTAQQLHVGFGALADRGFTDWETMIAYAKEKGRITVATAAADNNFFTNVISEGEGINMVIVPTAGAAEAVQQVLGGHVDLVIAGTTHVEHLRAGTMNQIFTLGATRAPFAPDAPATEELGYDMPGANYWWYAATPTGLDPEVQVCLAQALDEAVSTEEFAEVVARADGEARNIGAEAITELLESDFEKFKEYYASGGQD